MVIVYQENTDISGWELGTNVYMLRFGLKKDNYFPVSNLSHDSKVYETNYYFEKHFSPLLTGSHKHNYTRKQSQDLLSIGSRL